jgi:hypothetical protein
LPISTEPSVGSRSTSSSSDASQRAGVNPVSRLTAYERRNLVAHLVDGHLTDELHALLAYEWIQPQPTPPAPPKPRRFQLFQRKRKQDDAVITEQRRNAWHAARDEAGEGVEYGRDLDQALALATAAADEQIAACQPATAVGLEVRYCAIKAALNSYSTELGPELLRALVATGTWSVAHALAYALRAPRPQKRVDAMTGVLPLLDAEDREHLGWRALADVAEIRSDENVIGGHPGDHDRRTALARLAPHLTTAQLRTAIRLVNDLQENDRPYALEQLVPALFRSGERREALAALAAEPALSYGRFMTRVADVLSEQELREALIKPAPDGRRWDGVATLAPELARLGHTHEALSLIGSIPDGADRLQAVVRLARYIDPGSLTGAVGAARSLPEPEQRAQAIAALSRNAGPLAHGLTTEATRELLSVRNPYTMLNALAAIVDVLSREDAEALYARTRTWDAPFMLVHAAAALSTLLDEPLRSKAQAAIARDASHPRFLKDLVTSSWNVSDYPVDRTLPAMLAAASPELALELAARTLDQRRSVVNAMAIGLPHEFLTRAVDVAAGTIGDERNQQIALEALQRARLLSRPAGLEEILVVRSEEVRAKLLAEAAHRLEVADVDPALAAALAMNDGNNVARALSPLVPQLSEEQVDSALASLLGREHSYGFYQPDAAWIWLVALLAPRMTQKQLETALRAAVRRTDGDAWKGWALTSLVPHLPDTLLDEALLAARTLDRDASFQRDHVLRSLSLRRARSGDIDGALELPQEIDNDGVRSGTVPGLIASVPLDALDDLPGHLGELWDERPRSGTFLDLAARTPVSERERLIETALEQLPPPIWDNDTSELLGRAAGLAVGEQRRRILARIAELPDDHMRATALTSIASQLDPDSEQRALSIALETASPHPRALALLGLLPHLRPPARDRALTGMVAAVAGIDGVVASLAFRATVEAVPDADPRILHQLWSSFLTAIATRNREQFLDGLAEGAIAIGRLGGAGALDETQRALGDVARWWL